jgi:GH15 family glucan-1,4-alpha-glucosidase
MADASPCSRIEDYALIGNCQTVALVAQDGSIDWISLPRFDSDACFAALIGKPENGRWLLAPSDTPRRASQRSYRPRTLILETLFETSAGAVCVIDFLSRREAMTDLVRIVRGVRGTVSMYTELVVRFDYGAVVPWVSRQQDDRLRFTAGAQSLYLDTPLVLQGEDLKTVGRFDVSAGQEIAFVLSWTPSFEQAPARLPAAEALAATEASWLNWSASFEPSGEWPDTVLRSLLTLKALTHWQTGGIVAAGTTSLPEHIGGARNWDYRLCWLRDATFTLYALIGSGFLDEAQAWQQWLQRAVGGSPDLLQTMYGVGGERRLIEIELPWLSGYSGSQPVRIGNAASGQLQIDVYGEVIDAFFVARQAGLRPDADSWALECALLQHLESVWEQPDASIWEVRGDPRQFTYSKVMTWVAFDRAIRTAEDSGWQAPLDRWREIRDRVHALVCERGFDRESNSFVQYFGGQALDASLLRIALVGFLPPSDPRVQGTVAAIERHLLRDGLVLRYDSDDGTDGQAPGEGVFLACSFWLIDNYVLQERYEEGRQLFLRLLALCNDVGLLAEEYDPIQKCQLGNFPQAFSHLALINTARNLTGSGPAHHRSAPAGRPRAALTTARPSASGEFDQRPAQPASMLSAKH